MRYPLLWKEGAVETIYVELTITLFPVLLCGCRGKGGDEIRNKIERGKKVGERKVILRFDFSYRYHTLI